MKSDWHDTDSVQYLILCMNVATQGTYVFVWKPLDSSLRILRTDMYCEGAKFIRNMYY